MNIRRVPLPELPETPDLDDVFVAAYGDQPTWSVALPMAYRILASPHTYEPFIQPPDDDTLDSPGYRRTAPYYNTLLQLLVFHLGWPRPDRGIPAAIDQGADGPVLDLVHAIWDTDGTLALLLAWLVESGTDYLIPLRDGLADIAGQPPDHTPATPVDHLQENLRNAKRQHIATPLTAGTDGLHLSAHAGMPLDGPSPKFQLTVTSPSDRTAHLAIPSLGGWYRTLAAAGSTLPDLGARSWHVHVHANTVGYLGRFRRSRKTGLWFTGRHRTHVLGQ